MPEQKNFNETKEEREAREKRHQDFLKRVESRTANITVSGPSQESNSTTSEAAERRNTRITVSNNNDNYSTLPSYAQRARDRNLKIMSGGRFPSGTVPPTTNERGKNVR